MSFHFPCLPCLLSLLLYSASLPLSRQNLKLDSNELENEFLPFLYFSCPLGMLVRICHLFVPPFLGLTPPLSMAFHWKPVGKWVLAEKSSGQFTAMGSKFQYCHFEVFAYWKPQNSHPIRVPLESPSLIRGQDGKWEGSGRLLTLSSRALVCSFQPYWPPAGSAG